MLNLHYLLTKQIKWATKAFGPHFRWQGILDHAAKELAEIEAKPDDIEEWIDLWFLAFDGGWRLLHDQHPFASEEALTEMWATAYREKLAKNESREWPDWRTADPTKAIEHNRSGE